MHTINSQSYRYSTLHILRSAVAVPGTGVLVLQPYRTMYDTSTRLQYVIPVPIQRRSTEYASKFESRDPRPDPRPAYIQYHVKCTVRRTNEQLVRVHCTVPGIALSTSWTMAAVVPRCNSF